MTRLANTTLKGKTFKEVKTLLSKERHISKYEWIKSEINEYYVEYDIEKYLFVTIDENKIITKIEKLNLNRVDT